MALDSLNNNTIAPKLILSRESFMNNNPQDYPTNTQQVQQKMFIDLKIAWPYMSGYALIYNDSKLK